MSGILRTWSGRTLRALRTAFLDVFGRTPSEHRRAFALSAS